VSDWKDGGHAAECKAISENHPWADYKDDLVKLGGPIAESVVMRHFARFAAIGKVLEAELIERGHGGGGGGGGFHGGGGGGAFRGGGGGFRAGFGGGGYRAPLAVRRGGYRSSGFGGRPLRWGYRGYAFPWLFSGGLWYPWWYYLAGDAQLAAFYAARNAQLAYIDPSTGTNYGVPPMTAGPGSWGPVPPQARPIATVAEVHDAWIGAPFGKQGAFERLVVAHAKVVVRLAATTKGSKEREKVNADLIKLRERLILFVVF
jgi:hypothetical protein